MKQTRIQRTARRRHQEPAVEVEVPTVPASDTSAASELLERINDVLGSDE